LKGGEVNEPTNQLKIVHFSTLVNTRLSTVDMPAPQTYNDEAELHAESIRTPNSLACPEDVGTYVSTHQAHLSIVGGSETLLLESLPRSFLLTIQSIDQL
jgi:hypothetical protein